MAINQASKQFYRKIAGKELQSLGFSLVGFVISILLSITAVVLLYASSINMKVRASRSSYILALRNKIFTELEDDEHDENEKIENEKDNNVKEGGK